MPLHGGAVPEPPLLEYPDSYPTIYKSTKIIL
jgi:hypothetical protein